MNNIYSIVLSLHPRLDIDYDDFYCLVQQLWAIKNGLAEKPIKVFILNGELVSGDVWAI